jgi:hypothetical protein
LGLSVGVPNEDVAARYETLVAEIEDSPENHDSLDAIRRAFEVLRGE